MIPRMADFSRRVRVRRGLHRRALCPSNEERRRGISTFAQVESTIACGGTTTPDAIREIKRMGFKTVVNLRLASEQGALVDEEGASSDTRHELRAPAVQHPDADPKLVENFIAAVAGPTNTRPTSTARPAAARPRCG